MSHASPEPQDAAQTPPSTNPWLWIFIAMLLAAMRFWQVPFSSPADADAYLEHIAAIVPFDHVTRWHVFQELAANYRTDGPGWFPLAALPLVPWLFGLSVLVAKSLQYVLIVASFGIFAFVTRKLTGSAPASLLAVVLALCAWQFRTIHDPVIGTSFLTPWTAVVVLTAYAAWLAYSESGKTSRLALCYAALAIAVLTGPLAWSLSVVLGLVTLLSEHRKPAWGIWAILAAGTGTIIAGGVPQAPWQHAVGYASEVAAQLFAALPASFRAVGNLPVARVADLYHGTRYNDDRFILIPAITLAGWLFAMAAATVAFLATSASSGGIPAKRHGETLILGASLLVVPAFVLGPHGEWQAGLPAGQAFEGVYLEYFGLAVLLTALIRYAVASEYLAARLVPSLVALAVLVLSYGNARSDASALAWSTHMDEPRTLIARAAAAGFFDGLPESALIIPSPTLRFGSWSGSGIADPKYALFDYTGKRYHTGRDDPPRTAYDAWIVNVTSDAELPVTLAHWASGSFDKPLVDRALGYAISRTVWQGAAGRLRGVERSVSALRDGRSIDARRLCGPVAPEMAFAPSRPSLTWGSGFIATGPYGYNAESATPAQTALGNYISFFPKMYMGAHGIATILPSSCPPGTIRFQGVAVASRASHLTIVTADGVKHLALGSEPTTFVVRRSAKTRDPFVIIFQTDAPPADWEPIYFRYERDVPKERRIVIEPTDVWETP